MSKLGQRLIAALEEALLMVRDENNWIECPKCCRRSFHPKDIQYKYCSSCGFHEDLDAATQKGNTG
jgi:ribosomal protein L37E